MLDLQNPEIKVDEIMQRIQEKVRLRRQDAAENGDIVVALIGEEATVKRYFRESDHVRLQPENAAMEPILSRDAQVLGKVVGLMRSMS